MTHCWGQLWKTKQMETDQFNEKPKQEQLHEWEDWVSRQYIEPLPALQSARSAWGDN